VNLPADVLGELLKDRIVSSPRISWEQRTHQKDEK
jgi:hypothetical protein